MNTKHILSTCSMALLIAGSGMVDDAMARDVKSQQQSRPLADSPELLKFEDLGSGIAADLYRETCFARSITADVGDIGDFFDTNFQVCVNGSAGGIEGQSSCKISPQGGISPDATVSRSTATNDNLRAYVLFTEVNAAGPEKYDSEEFCTRADGTTVDPEVVIILDQ
jgi:hypothetical protein